MRIERGSAVFRSRRKRSLSLPEGAPTIAQGVVRVADETLGKHAPNRLRPVGAVEFQATIFERAEIARKPSLRAGI